MIKNVAGVETHVAVILCRPRRPKVYQIAMHLAIKVIWVPFEIGGRKVAPQPGFRCGIRWMRHIGESFEMYRDVSITSIKEAENNMTQLICEPITKEIPQAWLSEGEGVELLDGFRVIAVGQIN